MSRPTDQPKALRAAAEALELWQAQRFPEAEQRFRDALADADSRHHRTPDIHGEYASMLTQINRLTEAGGHYEQALKLEIQNGSGEDHPAVVAARYVLGEHYLRMADPDSARRVIAPSLLEAQKPLGWLVEAEALFQSGATAEARQAGERALGLASDAEQRERIRSRLSELWEHQDE